MPNGYIEKMWAIHGVCGLYVGTALTRSEAIRSHVHDRYIIPSPNFATEKKAWAKCRKSGDVAVKVEMKYTA